EKLDININPVLEAELRRDKISSDKSIRLFDLLLCLKDDIVTIQEKISIIGYTNQEMMKEADKNAKDISELDVEKLSELLSEVFELEVSELKVAEIFDL
ncbi:10601_t:CDS:2, partial [Ambispora gerdemannii]